MITNNETRSMQPWLFDGNPDYVDINITPTDPSSGGYIVGLALANGIVRLAATRHPSRYVTSWRKSVKRHGMPDIVEALVSMPHMRYEAIKRRLLGMIEEYRDDLSDGYRIKTDDLTKKMQELLLEIGG